MMASCRHAPSSQTFHELCPGEHAYALLQGLGLAHMDAHLRREPAAHAFLAQDVESVMSARGVKVRRL